MTVYNTDSDAANTAVRSFLTKVGEYYLRHKFDTGSGQGKRDWMRIKNEIFKCKCAYCDGSSVPIQIDHLIMFNREDYGLHHPGNTVPCCKECNKRGRRGNKYLNWEEHLRCICESKGELNKFEERKQRIIKHMKYSEYRYPDLSQEERDAVRIIANSLYDNIKTEHSKALRVYKDLQGAFIKQPTGNAK